MFVMVIVVMVVVIVVMVVVMVVGGYGGGDGGRLNIVRQKEGDTNSLRFVTITLKISPL